jgi:hypothetical protein
MRKNKLNVARLDMETKEGRGKKIEKSKSSPNRG